nr:coat protein [Botryotinia fuckeliana partitivirus 1]
MADTQSQISSSVAPSDSVSKAGRKSKPGKAERAARRSAVGSQPGQNASVAKAMTFATGVSTPKPQPGKYPVVFQTGAGEPSRDQAFSPDERSLASVLNAVPQRYMWHERYNEFRVHAEVDQVNFAKNLTVAALLRLAQQLVHSHVNMGLPQGDFAPVASTEVLIPSAVSAIVSQFGEFSVPALGTRYLLHDYTDTVKAIVHAAQKVATGKTGCAPVNHLWLPVRRDDGHTKGVIADRLLVFLKNADISIVPNVLEEAVLSGIIPDVWENIKPVLGDDETKRDRFDFLFKSYADVGQFVTAFTTASATAVRAELGLVWDKPSAGDLDWSLNVKETFTRLSDSWARMSTTYAAFFEMASGLTNRSAAVGSQSQMCVVSTTDSVTVVKTHLALSAPEFSLAACFPPTAVFSGDLPRRVVVTTPLSVTQRATEFVQLDWR